MKAIFEGTFTPIDDEDEPPASAPKQPGSREGKRFMSLYVEPEYHRRLKIAALNADLQLQEVMRQALDDWMLKHGA